MIRWLLVILLLLSPALALAQPVDNKPPLGVLVDWADPINYGLIGAWLFNQSSGTRVQDISGRGVHLTAETSGTLEGWVPAGFQHEENGRLVGERQAHSPEETDEFSFVWIGTFSSTQDQSPRLCDWFPSPSLYLRTNGVVSWWGSIRGYDRDTQIGNTAVDDDMRHTIVVTFDDTNTTVYIDGFLDQTQTTFTGYLEAPENTFTIGGRSTDYTRGANATIETCYLYTRALTAAEVASLHTDPYQGLIFHEPEFLWTATSGVVEVEGQLIPITIF